MKIYKVRIKENALQDIQEITDWYNTKQKGLGNRFLDTAIKQINNLNKYAFSFPVRYKNFRCMLISKFPYMVHYNIDISKEQVDVYAVISTSRNPVIWKEKTRS